MRMRHFLSTYLSFLMAHLEYTHAAQLQQVGYSSMVLSSSDTSDPAPQCLWHASVPMIYSFMPGNSFDS